MANDPRVHSKLSPDWIDILNSSFNTFPQGNMENSYKNVMDLHRAGVDILVGTDVTPVPIPNLGGLAHGASVHHEMQLLVKAGFTPIEALQSATSKPAQPVALVLSIAAVLPRVCALTLDHPTLKSALLFVFVIRLLPRPLLQ